MYPDPHAEEAVRYDPGAGPWTIVSVTEAVRSVGRFRSASIRRVT